MVDEIRTQEYTIVCADALTWLEAQPPHSIHAVVTDPPTAYSNTPHQLAKMKNGRGGVWRIPPSFDGAKRRPLPRFTVLTEQDKAALHDFFQRLARLLQCTLVPGAHVFVGTNPLVSYLLQGPFVSAGFEPRGEIIRVVQRLRGGDRPKNAHQEFRDVSVMPKSCWEPWLLFRKPCEGRVQDNLRKWWTGGLRRLSDDEPFKDLIYSSTARRKEYAIASHPSLKPQHFLRQIVRAALPLRKGIILDPFMGSGSTIAAAVAVGVKSVGIEIDPEYFKLASRCIDQLAKFPVAGESRDGSAERPGSEPRRICRALAMVPS